MSAAISCCMRTASEVDVEAMSGETVVVSFKEWFVIFACCGATTKQPVTYLRKRKFDS